MVVLEQQQLLIQLTRRQLGVLDQLTRPRQLVGQLGILPTRPRQQQRLLP